MLYAVRQYFTNTGILSWMKAVVRHMCLFYSPMKVLQSPYLEVVCSVTGNMALRILMVQ